ncbi:cytochrome c oxidase subunit 3 [Hymenobacter daecheongensis DSM 21074]|uniref:Cytochrome c oxidase subunit 3 n=1 Tax=Hymenobacter daecheongensis DSM 21074 TaxID=1121955 RepID=A0A1M6JRJ8_9BACT|nr:cytochrome c oxidase subunit 3 [Hymenobacter daecheongensis]SHJ49230.1 cytochrome c oxidase subunit 3 [Hymenobacter daecheongensis DSM 21074]
MMNSDKERKDRVGAGQPTSTFSRIERVPPLLMLLYLGLAGITVLFVILLAAYMQTRHLSGLPTGLHPLPRYFSLSTIVLLASSYTLSQAARIYRQDDVTGLGRCLGATLLLGCVFAGLQVLGWRELMAQGVFFTGEASGTYIYLISALHVAHLLGGMLFLLSLLLRTLHASRDAVRSLVFIRNPYRRLQLRMLGLYWHFIDGLWVVMFTLFLFLY